MNDNNEPKAPKTEVRWNAPGEGILLVTSVFFLIRGGVLIVRDLPNWSGWPLLMSVIQILRAGASTISFSAVLLIVAIFLITALAVFSNVLPAVLGIIGIKNRRNILNAKKLMVWGIVYVAAYGLFGIANMILGGAVETDWSGSAIRLAFAIGYIYGAHKNFKAWKELIS